MAYNSLVFEWIVQAANEQPEGPQEFEAKFEQVVRRHNKYPHEQEFQVEKCVTETRINEINLRTIMSDFCSASLELTCQPYPRQTYTF